MYERHGQIKTRLYRIWVAMRQRCGDPERDGYEYYGGRGVCVCSKWEKSFTTFRDWALANGYADDLSIDRIDSDKNYEPDNCRWSTKKQQSTNRGSACLVTIDGKTLTVAEWAHVSGIHLTTLYRRYRKGIVGVKEFLVRPVPNKRAAITRVTT